MNEYKKTLLEAKNNIERDFKAYDEEKRNKLRNIFLKYDTKYSNELIDAILSQFCIDFWGKFGHFQEVAKLAVAEGVEKSKGGE